MDIVTEAAKVLAAQPKFNVQVPWRLRRTPYRVFLAEFLLVRTRTDLVASRFENIYNELPDLCSLAAASQEKVEDILAPLGLRKRVPHLIKAAQYLQDKHGGEIPADPEELMKVPGLGLYTAVAISAFAYGNITVPADVNILRFISRLTGLVMTHKTKGSPELRALLPLLSQDRGGPTAEQLLDFTRLVCRPRKPDCPACPLNNICHYPRSQEVIVRS